MPESSLYYLLFFSIHDVLKIEKILKAKGIAFELVPVPRNLSSDCGMCVRLQNDVEKVMPLLGKIALAGCYRIDGKECTPIQP